MENLFALTLSPNEVKAISNLGLAHVGDGVFELLVRTRLCARGDRTVRTLHRDTVALVNAASQAAMAERLQPLLSEEEQDYFRRGKNAHTHAAPKAVTPRQYALATGLETLFGALYLLGRRERLSQLFDAIME